MKKIPTITVLLGIVGLSIPLLVGCGQQHSHVFVEHAAISATCTEPGNELYYSCEGCKKFFDADKKTEIEENSWVIASLDHDLKLAYSGNYKSAYLSGETFDSTGLVIKEICQRQNCGYENVVTNYTVAYQKSGQKLVAGDTKITVEYNQMSIDVPVSVSLRENVITGLASSYDVKCKEGVDLTGVTATKGDVSITYYEDEAYTEEVPVAELVGEKTYYALVKSDGIDIDYEIATEETVVNVTHDFEEQANKTVIGYKDNICKICEHQEVSTNVMEDADVVIESKDSFGMNASSLSNEKTEGVLEAGHPLFGTDGEPRVTVNSVLPKINYTAYSKVVMTFKSNGDTWNNSQIGIGIVEACNLLPYVLREKYPTFTLEIVYDSVDEALNVRMCDAGGASGTTIVDNPDVISGTVGLTLLVDVAMYRYIALNKILLNHDCSKCTQKEISRTDLIGKKTAVCDCCGLTNELETLMNEKDFSLTTSTSFGASNWNEIGVAPGWEPAGTEAKNLLLSALQTSLSKSSVMPKIDYSVYGKVEFEIRTNTADTIFVGIGINNENDLIPCSKHASNEYGVITITCGEDNKTLTINYLSSSSTLTGSVTLVDADVATGKTGLTIKATQSSGSYRNFAINRFAFNHFEHDELGTINPTDVIGYKDACCSTCGKPGEGKSSVVMEDKDINVKTNLYGASIVTSETDSRVYAKANGDYILYNFGVDKKANTTYTINLPKVNYVLYSKVVMTLVVPSGYFTMGLDETNSANTTNDGTTAILTVQKIDGTFSVSLKWTIDGSSTVIGDWSKGITDANVLSGVNSLGLYAKDPYGNYDRVVRVTKINVTKAQ